MSQTLFLLGLCSVSALGHDHSWLFPIPTEQSALQPMDRFPGLSSDYSLHWNRRRALHLELDLHRSVFKPQRRRRLERVLGLKVPPVGGPSMVLWASCVLRCPALLCLSPYRTQNFHPGSLPWQVGQGSAGVVWQRPGAEPSSSSCRTGQTDECTTIADPSNFLEVLPTYGEHDIPISRSGSVMEVIPIEPRGQFSFLSHKLQEARCHSSFFTTQNPFSL